MKKIIQTYVAQQIANVIYWYCQNSFMQEQFDLGFRIGMLLDNWATDRDIWLD